MTYSTKCDGPLLGRLALKEIEKRAKTTVRVAGCFAVLEAVDLEDGFVGLGFRIASSAVLLRHIVADILGEPRRRPGTSPTPATTVATGGVS
jgi:hypothetical protein